MMPFVRRALNRLDRFLFETPNPQICVLLRITYAFLLLIYVSVWLNDGVRWFSDEGVLSVPTAKVILNDARWSLFFWIPATPIVTQVCLSILLFQAACLLLGFFSRFQAACIFLWLLSFQHRNILICDGEDTVFRLFAFFFVFMPLDHAWSLSRRLFGSSDSLLPTIRNPDSPNAQAWGLRLVQIEMSLIYISAAWSKALGSSWQDGSALYYVLQMGDLFGRGWLPESLLQSESLIRFATWAVVIVEGVLPIALWWRPTRNSAILVGIGLHLAMEYSMNLFLFQWIMIVGLLSFLDPQDWRWLRPTKKTDATLNGAGSVNGRIINNA